MLAVHHAPDCMLIMTAVGVRGALMVQAVRCWNCISSPSWLVKGLLKDHGSYPLIDFPSLYHHWTGTVLHYGAALLQAPLQLGPLHLTPAWPPYT
jgi:hypothetical protein